MDLDNLVFDFDATVLPFAEEMRVVRWILELHLDCMKLFNVFREESG